MAEQLADSKNTINQTFQNTVESRGSFPALQTKVDGTYQSTTYDQFADQVKNFALGLRELGIESGDRVAILAENSQKWAVSDLGILALGAVNVPMFYTSTPAQVEYIVRDSGSTIICVSTKRQLEKVNAFFDNVPELEKVIVFDSPEGLDNPHQITFDQVIEMGRGVENGDQIYQNTSSKVEPEDLMNPKSYFDLVFEKLSIGGYIIADNVLWSGKVVQTEKITKDTQVILDFNRFVQEDDRVENVLFPIRDGLMIVRKK